MIALQPHAEGTVLPVRAQPGARRNGIWGEQAGMLRVCVTQPAEKGKANRALVELLCRSLSLRKSQVELIAGHTSLQKRLLIRGVSPECLQERIAQLLEGR